MFTPSRPAIRACLPGSVGAVKRKLAGAVSATDSPWGTMGSPVPYPGGTHPLTIPAIGYPSACGMWTPAFPKPIPAKVAAMAI